MAQSWMLACLLMLLAGCGGNRTPRIVSLVNREARVGTALELFVTAVDPDGDRLSYGIENKPERASFEATPLGGRFLWTPLASDVPPGESSRTYPITFVVDDGRGGRDAETALITVGRGAPGEGAPVFVTPADYVLDLAMTDTLDVAVRVQDEDSPEVALSLEEGPEGAVLTTRDVKSAELVWQPTEAQVAARALYTIRLRADDGDNEPVVQELTVLLKRKQNPDCPGEAPTVAHTPIGDQQNGGPFVVRARLVDPDGVIRAGTLFWSRRPNPSTADFESVPMRRDGSEADQYAATLPDLGLAAGTSASLTYFICATDDDDMGGDACDHVTCFPSGEGRLAFTATAGAGCPEDTQEPNDTPTAARSITSGTPLRALRMCGGNDDWFKLTLGVGDVLDAGITLSTASAVELAAYGPDGTTRLATASGGATATDKRLSIRATSAGVHYLRISAAAGQSATYELSATSRPAAACDDDTLEPNDTAQAAKVLGLGTRTGLKLCAGNDDWFKIALRAGDGLDISTTFVHAMGDLDLEVYRPDGTTLLGKSDGVMDGESLSFRVVPETGDYFIHVYGYMRAQNSYTLTLAGGTCRNDSLEPNDTLASAKVLATGVTRSLALCAGDEDWFKVSATAGQRLAVTARFLHRQGDLDLRIFRPDGSNLASSDSLDDDEQIIVPSLPVSGAYLLRIFSSTRAQNAYDLDVSVTAP